MKNIISLLGMWVLVGSLSSCSMTAGSRCVSGYSKPDISALRTQLAQQKQIWIDKNLKSYAYTRETFGYVPIKFPLRITVTNGSVISVTAIQNPGQPKPNWTEPADKSVFLMDRTFTGLESDLTYVENATCGLFTAEYNVTYGFPDLVNIGDVQQNLADVSAGVKIFDFTITP
jgi:Family of unknown function (DUF6174)